MLKVAKYNPERKLKRFGLGKDYDDPENIRILNSLHCVTVAASPKWEETFSWCEQMSGDDWIWAGKDNSTIEIYFVHSEHAVMLKLKNKTA